jgi:hypothetical protein
MVLSRPQRAEDYPGRPEERTTTAVWRWCGLYVFAVGAEATKRIDVDNLTSTFTAVSTRLGRLSI